ncbi:TKL family protein kinase [Trichomonas vaginalis G3]|uniref:TKL family protein kinase n=1 Tax=Trichomonas vaginalis (strain ATCC PRA-98 / G3) TaxID=412133 RepID=A2FC72_TRIV3|nr:protein kinase protein [Trichomonas vaginalis G3]EAX97485.1 TKL family protein kinase [Trichomonas vaginalis G3]KAI5547055.1 protein kinase protein [Trichomonas vaginalis G3]|eukprot:XP_001310415.1 TKL family protein kinase [Trichomonas vaginalis G3]
MTDISQKVNKELIKYCCDLNEFKFGERIGEGGFSEVFFAIHQPTGIKTAVKKLYLKKMEGDDLVLFRRELENLAECDNMFILPFLGCTLSYPFTIITKLIPNGSLFGALKDKKNNPKLTGTEKTILAFGIAHGMAYLHSHGIMHRDLKSLNILLDEKKYPIICDFGLSRKENEGFVEGSAQYATRDVGTPHWMAPEIYSNAGTYTNKVDVYSYGIILWEMLAESAPFNKMSPAQIMFTVCQKKERPAIPHDSPKFLKSLIERCWNQDPEKRPSFATICKKIKHNPILYGGTVVPHVENFIKQVEADEKTRCKIGEWKAPPLTPMQGTPKKQMGGSPIMGMPQKMQMGSSPMMNQQMVMGGSPMMQGQPQMAQGNLPLMNQGPHSVSMHQRIMQQPQVIQQQQVMMQQRPQQVNYVILSHPERSDFIEVFNAAVSMINTQNATEFFSHLKGACKDSTPQQIYLQFLPQVSQVVQSDVNYCQCMIQTGFHYFLPYKTSGLSSLSLIILNTAVLNFPQVINTDLLNILAPTVQTHANLIIDILILYFRNGNHLSNNAEVFDFITNNANTFVTNSGDYFLTFYYNLITTYQSQWPNRVQDIPKVLTKAFTSQNNRVIKAAYKFAIEFIDQKVTIDSLTLSLHIKNKKTRRVAASYLARITEFEYTQELVDALIDAAQDDKVCLICLYNALSHSTKASSVAVTSSLLWSKTNRLSIIDKMTITIILASNEANYNLLANSDGFCAFLADIPFSKNVELIDVVTDIIIKLEPTKPFIQTLKRAKFFTNYFNSVPYLGSQNAIVKSLYVIYVVGTNSYIEDFMLYKGYLIQMLNMNNEYTPPALSALAVLTTYPEAVKSFKAMNLMQILGGISNVPNYQVYIDAITANLNSN